MTAVEPDPTYDTKSPPTGSAVHAHQRRPLLVLLPTAPAYAQSVTEHLFDLDQSRLRPARGLNTGVAALAARPARHIYGKELAAVANPPLQRLTAWGATAIMRALQILAIQQGTFIALSRVHLDVEKWCFSFVSMKSLLLVAVTLILIGHTPLLWKAVLPVAARGWIKDWTESFAPGLGLIQMAILGWLAIGGAR
jgi:hypothetical protein